MNDRIKLAELQGWKRVEHDFGGDTWKLGHVIAFGPDTQRTKENEIPDPFTDANDCEALIQHLKSIGWSVGIEHDTPLDSVWFYKGGEKTSRHYMDWKQGVCELALKVIG